MFRSAAPRRAPRADRPRRVGRRVGLRSRHRRRGRGRAGDDDRTAAPRCWRINSTATAWFARSSRCRSRAPTYRSAATTLCRKSLVDKALQTCGCVTTDRGPLASAAQARSSGASFATAYSLRALPLEGAVPLHPSGAPRSVPIAIACLRLCHFPPRRPDSELAALHLVHRALDFLPGLGPYLRVDSCGIAFSTCHLRRSTLLAGPVFLWEVLVLRVRSSCVPCHLRLLLPCRCASDPRASSGEQIDDTRTTTTNRIRWIRPPPKCTRTQSTRKRREPR